LQNAESLLIKYDTINGGTSELQRGLTFYSICDNFIVYSSGHKVYRCDFNGSNNTLFENITDSPFCSDRYLIVDTVQEKRLDSSKKRELIIYDMNGNELSKVNIDTFANSNMIYGCAGNIIFIPDDFSRKNEFGSINALWIIDLNDLGAGAPGLKKVFEFVPKVEDRGVQTSGR
jgi:hypothetical protein